MVAIVGGSKVSTKLIVGGGIANTFLAAAGHPVGKSLYEPDLLDTARAIAAKVSVPLPVDVVVAKEFAESAICHSSKRNELPRPTSMSQNSVATTMPVVKNWP